MRQILLALAIAMAAITTVQAGLDAKIWPATDKAKQFVKDTVVVGMLASPYGVGWSKNEQLLKYFAEARSAGITGHDVTLAAASQNWEAFILQHQKHRMAMAEQPPSIPLSEIFGTSKLPTSRAPPQSSGTCRLRQYSKRI